MKLTINKAFWAMTFLMSVSNVFAVDLMHAYQDALMNDPAFRAAISTRLSQREAKPQALAALLPNVTGSALVQQNHTDVKSSVFGVPSGTATLDAYDYQLNISQPVFDYTHWMKLRQANAIVKQAQANFDASAQNLMIRVAQAYFNVLQAEDTLRYTTAEKEANAKQYQQAKERYRVGVEPITSVNEARAGYDSAVAAEIAAKNTVENSYEALWQITGKRYPQLAKLKGGNLPLIKPTPANVDAWVNTAQKQNYTLLAAKYAMQASRENIKVQRGGHIPTLDFIASYDTQKNNQVFFEDGDIRTRTGSFGVQLSVPVYQGGAINSQTKQAAYDYQTSMAQYHQNYRSTVTGTRQSFNDVISGISQIKADRQAVISAMSSLESTTASYQVGTRTMVDVLNEQKNLYNSQRQLAVDQYSYINSILALKQYAGTLSANDLMELNSWLTSNK